jgi:hypothetical protein
MRLYSYSLREKVRPEFADGFRYRFNTAGIVKVDEEGTKGHVPFKIQTESARFSINQAHGFIDEYCVEEQEKR